MQPGEQERASDDAGDLERGLLVFAQAVDTAEDEAVEVGRPRSLVEGLDRPSCWDTLQQVGQELLEVVRVPFRALDQGADDGARQGGRKSTLLAGGFELEVDEPPGLSRAQVRQVLDEEPISLRITVFSRALDRARPELAVAADVGRHAGGKVTRETFRHFDLDFQR